MFGYSRIVSTDLIKRRKIFGKNGHFSRHPVWNDGQVA